MTNWKIVLGLFLVGVICAQAFEFQSFPFSAKRKVRTVIQRTNPSPLRRRDPGCLKDNGMFPIEGDCHHYLVCKGGRAHNKTCPTDFSYDTYEHCTLSKDADCGVPNKTHAESRELCPLNFGLFSYKGDCHKYVSCDGGKGTVKNCPEGQVFQEYVGCVTGTKCPQHSAASGPKPDKSVCILSPDAGTCDGASARFYFDIESHTCHQFTYGGCGGNGNNFHRRDECMEACRGAVCPKSRGMVPIPGDCHHYLVCSGKRVQKRTCPEGFRYDTYEHCTLSKDADCGIPNTQHAESRELCPLNFGLFPYKGDCHKYVSCDKGRGTVKDCPKGQVYQEFVGCVVGSACPPHSAPGPKPDQSVCLLSPEAGSCDGVFPRYYFDIESHTCHQFTYGGCGGKGNNFHRKDECMEACRGAVCPKSHGMVPIPGDCHHYLVCRPDRVQKKTCPEGFRYDTYEHCTLSKDADCGIPNAQHAANRELCPMNFGLFSYKPDCHKYVSCDGGKGTVKDCPEGQVFQEYVGCVVGSECPSHSSTGPKPDQQVCKLPHEAGQCDSAFSRYYYCPESKTCKQFIYGGCGGNGNNFHRKDECMEACSGSTDS